MDLQETAEQSAHILLQYQVLGVIAVAFLVLLIWLFRSHARERQTFFDLLREKDQTIANHTREFSEAATETARALTELSTYIRATHSPHHLIHPAEPEVSGRSLSDQLPTPRQAPQINTLDELKLLLRQAAP